MKFNNLEKIKVISKLKQGKNKKKEFKSLFHFKDCARI